MTRSEFVSTVARKARITRSAADRAIDAIFDGASGAISEALHGAGSLSLRGFGRFTAARAATQKTEEAMTDGTSISFRAGRPLESASVPAPRSRRASSRSMSEAEIRAELLKGFRETRGVEIADVFAAGDQREKIRP